MKKKVLLTGLTGFIGGNVASNICDDFDVTAFVRPGTAKERYSRFEGKVNIIELSLSDKDGLRAYLERNSFNYILHIGGLRGGRKYSREEYLKTNVVATQILINNAIRNNTQFVFCSSVGVYGAIPIEVPATHTTPYKEDNLYHITKVRSEQMVKKAIAEKALYACIVRPAITYGKGDDGFPFTLTKLVDKRLLFLPKDDIYIHLTNVDLLTDVFTQLLKNGFESGKVWNVADREKVCFKELVGFIYKKLGRKGYYPKSRYVNRFWFKVFTGVAKLVKNELWTSRFELISNDWYYDVEDTYRDFELREYRSIPEFEA